MYFLTLCRHCRVLWKKKGENGNKTDKTNGHAASFENEDAVNT